MVQQRLRLLLNIDDRGFNKAIDSIDAILKRVYKKSWMLILVCHIVSELLL